MCNADTFQERTIFRARIGERAQFPRVFYTDEIQTLSKGDWEKGSIMQKHHNTQTMINPFKHTQAKISCCFKYKFSILSDFATKEKKTHNFTWENGWQSKTVFPQIHLYSISQSINHLIYFHSVIFHEWIIEENRKYMEIVRNGLGIFCIDFVIRSCPDWEAWFIF